MQGRALKLVAVIVAALVATVALLYLAPPLSLFHPPELTRDRPLRVTTGAATDPVELSWDTYGVPHVSGKDEKALALGLGFAHGRERGFQLELVRHAAAGRLTELFGEDVLWLDQRLRLVSYRLDEQLAELSPRARVMLEAYAEGVNLGRAHAGRSLEMVLLGLTPSPWTPRDSLAIARLQAWELAFDFTEELARDRVAKALPPSDPRRELFLLPVPDGGVPIARDDENEVRPAPTEVAAPPPSSPPAAPKSTPARRPQPARQGERSAFSRGLLAWLGQASRGASNSWVVHGSRTTTGTPVLCNDPHLRHTFPGVFYLAHLESPDVSVAGVTFPGIPAVLIGRTRHLAWGMTTSYVDTQDLVRLQLDGAERYVVDGSPRPLRTWTETYRLGPDTDAAVVSETWRATPWGPLLPPGYDSDKADGDALALLWTGFVPGGINAAPFSGFWDLAYAKDLAAADRAISEMSIAGQNVSLALTDGTIAYRLAAAVPLRASAEPSSLPRDGSKSDAGWRGFLAHSDKPRLTNPSRGYLVTANQRVVSDTGAFAGPLGGMAAQPHRARRITERLDALLQQGKASPEDILAIQQDVLSVEARDLLPAIAATCTHEVHGIERGITSSLCGAVKRFDGAYSEGAAGALPFALLLEALRVELLAPIVGEMIAQDIAEHPSMASALERAVLSEARLFDDPETPAREDLATIMPRAVRRAAEALRTLAGDDPEGWRWGDLHHLSLESPLARAPVIGRWFTSSPVAQGGHGSAPRAEQGLPVGEGAAFRMLAVMSDPPAVRMVIDSGNSGHVGHRHALDQREAWRTGALLELPFERAAIEAATVGRVVLEPAP